MNPIVFPGLGLTIHIERVAFSIFGKDIYWYGIIIACGFLLAVAFACRLAKEWGIKTDTVLDMLFFAAPIGIICARIYYVLFYQSLYYNADGTFNWGEAIAIWDGGIAIYGGIIGAALTCLAFCLVFHHKFSALADLGAYGLLIGQLIGRWGNFINQEAYGSACSAFWRMGLTLQSGEYIEVHPTFLYESLWNLCGFLLLYFVVRKRRKYDGQIFLCYLFWYGLGRFFIEGLRTDSLYLFNTGLRVSQVVALLTAVVSLQLLVIQQFRKHPKEAMLVYSPKSELAGEGSAASREAPEKPGTLKKAFQKPLDALSGRLSRKKGEKKAETPSPEEPPKDSHEDTPERSEQ